MTTAIKTAVEAAVAVAIVALFASMLADVTIRPPVCSPGIGEECI